MNSFRLSTAATTLYFLPLLVLNNPFLALPAPVKFSMAGACLMASVVLVLMARGTFNISLRVLLLACLLMAAAMRLNPLPDLADSLVRMQIGFSVLILLAGGLIFRHLPAKDIPKAILIVTVPYIAMIWLHRDGLLYRFDTDYRVGDLTADSYLSTGYFFGLFALASAFYLLKAHTWRARGVWFAAIAGVLYLALYNPARGEMLAMVLCLSLMFIPRLTVAGMAALPFLVPPARWVIFSFDFPVFERLRPMLGEGLGIRGELYVKAVEYGTSDIGVFLFGGGANAFQRYFGHEPSLYPHNLYLEALATSGFAMMVFVVWITLKPTVGRLFRLTFHSTPWAKFVTALCLFNLLIVLKAGSVLTLYSFYLLLPLFSSRVRRQIRDHGESFSQSDVADAPIAS